MKKLILFLLALCLFYSCKNSNKSANLKDRAIDSINAYMKQNLNDPGSYQPVEFGSLDTTMNDYTQDEKYFTLKSMSESTLHDEADDLLKNMALYRQREKAGYYKKQEKAGLKGLDSLKKYFVPKLSGYRMLHSYRAKNNFGAITLHQPLIKFRKDLSIYRVIE